MTNSFLGVLLTDLSTTNPFVLLIDSSSLRSLATLLEMSIFDTSSWNCDFLLTELDLLILITLENQFVLLTESLILPLGTISLGLP